MKKKLLLGLLTIAALSMTACGNGGDDTQSTEASSLGEAIGEEESYGEIELGEYKGLAVEKKRTNVDDAKIDSKIEDLVEAETDYVEVDRAAKQDDNVYFNFTAKSGDEVVYDYSSEEYYLIIGEEELGEKFDNALVGHKAGDNIKVKESYDEEYFDANIAGKTVEYDITINSVKEAKTPELTEDFIINTLGYESEADMREKLKAELTEEENGENLEEMHSALIQMVIENSTISSYSQSLYDGFKEEVEAQYEQTAQLMGLETAQDVYDMYGMTEEDVNQEILSNVYQVIVVDAIAKAEGIDVTDEEIHAEIEEYIAEDENINSEDEFLEAYGGEESVRYWVLEEKVLDFLAENAEITEVDALASELSEEDTEEE